MDAVLGVIILVTIVLVDAYLRDRQRKWIQREIDALKRRANHIEGMIDRLRERVEYKSSTKKGSS